MADWVATVALGNLATNQGDLEANSNPPDPNNLLRALWAPFLLLHLGGPDTITAYSLEDNDLWLRHLLGFVVQVAVALYVFMRSWSQNVLTFISIPIFICGIAKYGERTWVIWSSSAERFRDSLLSSASDASASLVQYLSSDTPPTGQPKKHEHILAGHLIFEMVPHLYAGLLLKSFEAFIIPFSFDCMLAEDVFSIIAIALGFMYDTLFTKNTIVYSPLGFFLRCVSFISSVTILIIFSTMINISHYSLFDISITFVLLVGALVLEFYSFTLHFFSDWTRLCLTKVKRENRVRAILDSPRFSNKRWSESMGQFSLISYCLKQGSVRCFSVEMLIGFNKFAEKYMYSTWKDVSVELREVIHKEFVEKLNRVIPFERTPEVLDGAAPNILKRYKLLYNSDTCKKILSQRGDSVLECYHLGGDFRWCTVDVDFDHSLLIWHVATDICYYDDFDTHHEGDHGDHKNCSYRRNSKQLSDYMLYLLLLRPLMVPRGIGELRFKETCDKAKGHLRWRAKKNGISNKTSEETEAEAYCKDLSENVNGERGQQLGDELSVLYLGCKLAKQLKSLSGPDWNYQRKWEMICKVWVEMLGYAAIRCEWREHCQQLKNGGELITHVALLMTHLGFNERFRSYVSRTRVARIMRKVTLFNVQLAAFDEKLREFAVNQYEGP